MPHQKRVKLDLFKSPVVLAKNAKTKRKHQPSRICREDAQSAKSSRRELAKMPPGGAAVEVAPSSTLWFGMGRKELAVIAVMTACNFAAANMQKAQTGCNGRAFAFLGGMAMHSHKDSPISVEIVARCGSKFCFRLRVIVPVAALLLLVSTVSSLVG